MNRRLLTAPPLAATLLCLALTGCSGDASRQPNDAEPVAQSPAQSPAQPSTASPTASSTPPRESARDALNAATTRYTDTPDPLVSRVTLTNAGSVLMRNDLTWRSTTRWSNALTLSPPDGSKPLDVLLTRHGSRVWMTRPAMDNCWLPMADEALPAMTSTDPTPVLVLTNMDNPTWADPEHTTVRVEVPFTVAVSLFGALAKLFPAPESLPPVRADVTLTPYTLSVRLVDLTSSALAGGQEPETGAEFASGSMTAVVEYGTGARRALTVPKTVAPAGSESCPP